MIQVVNKYKHRPTPEDVYVGRGSPLGNPFSWHPDIDSKFRVADRAEAISKYSEYAKWARMNNAPFHNTLNHLTLRALKGENINLVCFCKPLGCHGDIIKKMIEDAVEQSNGT